MSDVIDLNGATLDGLTLESGKTYTNGSMRYVSAKKTEAVTLDRITIITGAKHGIDATGAKDFKALGCAIVSEGIPASGTFGIFFRNGQRCVIDQLAVSSARLAFVGLNSTDIEITDSDFVGCTEDAVRIAGCQRVGIKRCQMHDFATEEVGGDATHPDAIQVYGEVGNPCAEVTIEDNLMFTGGGSIFQGIFVREYSNRPATEGLYVRRNTVLSRMANGITVSGTGEMVDNFVTGYAGDVTAQAIVGGTWAGSRTAANAAQFWSDRGTRYQAGWAPDGNTIADPVTKEREAQIVADWRAKFRPVVELLPEGLSAEVLAYLDARYGRETV